MTLVNVFMMSKFKNFNKMVQTLRKQGFGAESDDSKIVTDACTPKRYLKSVSVSAQFVCVCQCVTIPETDIGTGQCVINVTLSLAIGSRACF